MVMVHSRTPPIAGSDGRDLVEHTGGAATHADHVTAALAPLLRGALWILCLSIVVDVLAIAVIVATLFTL